MTIPRPGILLIAACLSATGCAPPGARSHPVRIQVESDPGVALSGVAVRCDGQVVQHTDSAGRALAPAPDQGEGRIELSVDCPPGHRQALARSVRAQHDSLRTLVFQCPPEQRRVAVVMRLPGAEGLPVWVDGQLIGTVAADGTVHVLQKRSPGGRLRIQVDTGDDARLQPAMFARTFYVRDRDALFLVDQRFDTVRPRSSRRRRAPRGAPMPPPRRPSRLRRL